MPDKDGYPTEKELRRIREWNLTKENVHGFLRYIEECWWNAEWGFCLTGKRVLTLDLHTGGWSGNEEIIEVLQSSHFWLLYWRNSRRGGHYTFKIPVKKPLTPE